MSERSIRVAVGLIAPAPGWEMLLEQIGIDWFLVSDLRTVSPELCSLIVCNCEVNHNEMEALRSYASSGGAVLFTFEAASVLETIGKQRTVRSLPPAAHRDHWYTEVLDLHGAAWFFHGDVLIHSGNIGDGFISYVGADIETVFTADASARRSFHADRHRLPHERVARRTKMPLRQMLMSHMEFLHHQRGLPFIHKWFYPRDEQSIATFRIDSDKGTKAEIDEIFTLSERYAVPTTWFLDVKSHEPWLDHFRTFGDQEIAVHCYEHIIYTSALLNKENFEKALMLLRKNGLDAVGIAAPTGAWNRAVGTAIQELGFRYSSEFSYDYDDLPSFPRLNGIRSSAVQLPVHPTCIGTMRRERMSEQEMVRYFVSVIDRKRALREPICLYHHPGHRTNNVIEEVFQYIRSTNIGMMPYKRYAAWWKQRDACRVHTTVSPDGLRFTSTDAAEDTFVRITFADGREAYAVPEGATPLDGLKYRSIPVPPAVPHDIMRTRNRRPGHFLQNALDWWIKATE